MHANPTACSRARPGMRILQDRAQRAPRTRALASEEAVAPTETFAQLIVPRPLSKEQEPGIAGIKPLYIGGGLWDSGRDEDRCPFNGQ